LQKRVVGWWNICCFCHNPIPVCVYIYTHPASTVLANHIDWHSLFLYRIRRHTDWLINASTCMHNETKLFSQKWDAMGKSSCRSMTIYVGLKNANLAPSPASPPGDTGGTASRASARPPPPPQVLAPILLVSGLLASGKGSGGPSF
jgi:hypothetical protein